MSQFNKSEAELLAELRRGTLQAQDSTTNAQNVVDYAHHEVHSGRAYVFTDVSELDDGQVRAVRIQVPDSTRWTHMLLTVVTSNIAEADLIEDTSFLHDGANALTAFNRNRNSVNVSGMTLCHTPAGNSSSSSGVTDDVLLAHQAWGTAGKGASPGFGGSARGSAEWVLKQNTAYLLTVTSAADSNVVSIEGDWYEHVNK